MAMSLSSQFTGRVVSVNPKGLKLEGHDDWCNVSRFAEGVVLPERGETVTVTVDKSGFLRAVEVIGALPRVAGGSDFITQPAVPSAKDRTITRLAVLKAAAEYASSKPQSSSADVLKIAASWERWILRSDDPTDDPFDSQARSGQALTDAF
jgi:hypothetical protein